MCGNLFIEICVRNMCVCVCLYFTHTHTHTHAQGCQRPPVVEPFICLSVDFESIKSEATGSEKHMLTLPLVH